MSTSSLSDADLLDLFSREQDDDAFGELVRRHVGWVHCTSLRLMFGDGFAAEEVTQDVFTDLARKAARLAREVRGGKPLVGWLHSGTRLAASNHRRALARRFARELQAREQNGIDPMNPNTANTTEWEEIRPLIDEALAELSPADRDAVLMRFFEERDLRSIGGVLGVSEDAARKRVDRALDRLRDWMESRGVRTTAAVLVSAVMAHGVVPPPVGLSERIASRALLSRGGMAVSQSARWNWIAAVGTVLVGFMAWGVYERSSSRAVPMSKARAIQNVETADSQTASPPSVNSSVAPSGPGSSELHLVRIPKRFLDRFSFQSLVMTNASDRRFVPSRRFVELFRLTPAEVAGVVAAMDKALHAYRTIEGQRLTPTAPPEPNQRVPFLESNPSRLVVLEKRHFALKPFPEEAMAIHQELETALHAILGVQRGAAFVRMGTALKGEMKTFETTQMVGGVPAQMAIDTLLTYRLVQLEQGPIVDLERSTGHGGMSGYPIGEELYRYVPEGLRADLARWQEFIREKGSNYFESAAAQWDPDQDPSMGTSEDSLNLGAWDDESLTVEIPKGWLNSLGIAGLTPKEDISEDAIGLCGLTEAEVSSATTLYSQTKERFLELERKNFVRSSSNALEFVLHAFPRENESLRLEFAQSLRNLLGDERGEMLAGLIRTRISMRHFSEWMRRPREAGSHAELMERLMSKGWMDRGDHEIRVKLVEMGGVWSMEYRSLTDPNDVGTVRNLSLGYIPLRWRHLLPPELVGTPAAVDRE